MRHSDRYLLPTLQAFSHEKMVLLAGPRQVGKTTLAKQWLSTGQVGLYLNWDIPEDRERLLKTSFMGSIQASAVVLDEIHKYARWKSWLKGLYDKKKGTLEIVVTGSARLDIFQKGGDSLLGRYELLRLHPLSVGELSHGRFVAPPSDWLRPEPPAESSLASETWDRLRRRSGFPEPFFKDEDLQHRRWGTRRRELLIREDLRELSQIKTLSMVEHLALLLPGRVGAPLSVNSLREELQVAYDTTKSWIDALERLHFCFRIQPYFRKLNRSLKKEQKLYLWDWSQIENEGARFENMVASHLLKSVHGWTDVGYGQFELHYWRDVEKREVDFLITRDRKPVVLIECKRSDLSLSPSLLRLGEMLGGEIPQVQLVDRPGVDQVRGVTRVVSADRYLEGWN